MLELRIAWCALLATATLAIGEAALAQPDKVIRFDIPAQPVALALELYARQAGVEFLVPYTAVAGVTSTAVKGELDRKRALQLLLRGTGLEARFGTDGAIQVMRVNPETAMSPVASGPQELLALARVESEPRRDSATHQESVEATVGVPELLVKGRRTINSDIQRSEDSTQPYVVFDRTQIERSMASTLEEFLKTRLPMNTVQSTNGQLAVGNTNGNRSAINLRGLGTNQTLILVDGRRMPSATSPEGFGQPDINGIPLASIERIEILPATASGIYGGGATGGVINIITRKDYSGLQVNLTYNNVFDTDASSRRIDVSGGLDLEGGRTQLLLSGSHADGNPLLVRDRDLSARGRALQLANNPNAFYNLTTPPSGATSNIRSQNGSVLQLKPQFGGTSLGSPRTHVPAGYAGAASDGGARLVANAGVYNLRPPEDVTGGQQSLLNNPTIDSAALNLRREFSARTQAFLDLSWLSNQGSVFSAGIPTSTTLSVNAPNNPFTTPVVVRFPGVGLSRPIRSESQTERAIAGVIASLPGEWMAAGEYLWSRSRNDSAFTSPVVGDPDLTGPGQSVLTALSTGVLDVTRDLNVLPLDYSPYLMPSPNYLLGPAQTLLQNVTARLTGPVFRLPGGNVVLSALAERQREEAGDFFEESMNFDGTINLAYVAGAIQRFNSYYVEARAPLFSAANALPMLRELELHASVRRDDYSTRATTSGYIFVDSRDVPTDLVFSTNNVEATKYTVGLRYSPVQDLLLRASLGTGFLPPAINQIGGGQLVRDATFTLADPRRGGVPQTITFDYFSGGNPDLTAEESESWSAGLVLTPRVLPGLRLSIDYINIDKTNELTNFGFSVLNLEDLFPERVVRDPLTAEDAALGYTGGVIQLMDISPGNFARTQLEAYDVQADYSLDTGSLGSFEFHALATWQPHFRRQAIPGTAFLDSVGFNNGQLEWRGNAGVSWERNTWTVEWSTQYYDAYRVYAATAPLVTANTARLNQGSSMIPSQLYHDLLLRYRFDRSAAGRLTDDLEIAVGIQNLFDRSPPILATTGAAGGYSTYGDPRLRRYSVTLRKGFQ